MYGFTTQLKMPFDAAVTKVTEALKKEGFGVLTTFVYESTPDFFSDPFFLKHADMQQVNQLN